MEDDYFSILPNVVLFKSLSQESDDVSTDSYLKRLKHSNINAILLPTLQYFYKNLEDLTNALTAPELFSGIVFLSPRCVHAVFNCLPYLDGSSLKEDWSLLNIFVIGETTGRLVADELKLKHKGSSSGSLKSLIDVIAEDTYDKPLLMPCGNLHDRSEEDVLKSRNIIVKYIEVYDTGQHSNLAKRISLIFSSQRIPEILVFFSPSGVKAVLPHIPEVYKHHLSFVAIGPKTRSALLNVNVKVTKTCLKPTEDDLLEAITSVLEKQS